MTVQDGQKNQNNLTDIDPIDRMVCDTFFSENILSKDEIKEMLDNLQLSISNSDKTFSKHIRYDTIAKKTFDFYSKNGYEGLTSKIEGNLASIEEVIADSDKYTEDVEDVLKDFREHVYLSIEEAKYVGNIVGEAKEAAKSAEKEAKNATGNNIAILGIFTAITFAVFGSIGSFTQLFSKRMISVDSIGPVFVITALFGLLIYGIISVLFEGINKLLSDKYELGTYISSKLSKIICLVLFTILVIGIIFIFYNYSNYAIVLFIFCIVIGMAIGIFLADIWYWRLNKKNKK